MTLSCLFSPHTKINTPLSQKATKYCWKIIHSDADDIVHYPQDPRSPGLPPSGPSWSLGWFLLPPWWASCAAWRTQRWTQHNTATISTPFFFFLEKKRGRERTLSMILPFSCVGEGSCSAICSTGSVRSLSPNTSLKMRAIWRCRSREQCSSMDRITGYLRGKRRRQKAPRWPWPDRSGTTGVFVSERIGRWFKGNQKVWRLWKRANTSAEFDTALTQMWRKRARWWPWPRPQTWSWSSGSSRGRWLAPQVLPSSPLGPFRNTQDKRKGALLIHSRVQFLSVAVHFLQFTSEDFALVIQRLLSLNVGLYNLFENSDWVILTLNTAAPQAQASRVSLGGRLAAELIARQVAVEQAAKTETRFILRFFNDLTFQRSAEDTVCKKKKVNSWQSNQYCMG